VLVIFLLPAILVVVFWFCQLYLYVVLLVAGQAGFTFGTVQLLSFWVLFFFSKDGPIPFLVINFAAMILLPFKKKVVKSRSKCLHRWGE